MSVGPGPVVQHARLAYASMGPRPLRAYRAEAGLRGQPATEESFRAAAEAALGELDPGTDLQATRGTPRPRRESADPAGAASRPGQIARGRSRGVGGVDGCSVKRIRGNPDVAGAA